ncbi:tetratricopeptide repeat protein, partial [Candidatus Sumerlaeota bacterium]|nr:tetratricopeptide repeat protein [Candidatus Sumerlaeota bacterium]
CLTKEGAFDIPSLSAGLKIGFWISASFACDIPPAFIIGVSFAVWVAVRAMIHSARWAAFAGFVFGVLPLIICYAALNFHILGSPLPPNMHESEMLLYKGSFWAEQKARSDRGDPGYYEASYSRRIFHSTLGHKGIYWMMTLISWATIAALARAWRNRRERVPLTALALFPPLTVLVVMRWAIDLSGGAYGIRHVFATLPPLYCVLGLSLSGLKKGALTRAIFLATGIWGGAIAWIGVINPWSHNTLSPIPPLENLARLSLKHPGDYPTGWIEGLIESTSVDLQTSWLDLGLEHLAGKRPDKAEVSLKHAVLAKPSAALPYYHLGIALDMQRKSAEAIEVYEKLLSLEPNNLGGWNNIGIFALHARKIDLAKRAFEKSLTLAPGNATGLWGSLIIDQFEGAVNPNSPKLTEALSRHPDDPRIQALAKSWGRGLDPDPLIEKSPAHSAK